MPILAKRFALKAHCKTREFLKKKNWGISLVFLVEQLFSKLTKG